MQTKWALEIGEHIVGVLAPIIFGDNAVGLNRRAGIARIVDGHGYAPWRFRKCSFRISIAERTVAREIGAELGVEQRRPWLKRCERIDDRR